MTMRNTVSGFSVLSAFVLSLGLAEAKEAVYAIEREAAPGVFLPEDWASQPDLVKASSEAGQTALRDLRA